MQAGHFRAQSRPSGCLVRGPDWTPPRPKCDMVGCEKRSDVIFERTYMCAGHGLIEMKLAKQEKAA